LHNETLPVIAMRVSDEDRSIFYDASGQGGGNDIELNVTAITAVPEPTTWIGGALAIPFIVFVYIQRRRRAQMLRSA
jgi:hypothetical protein